MNCYDDCYKMFEMLCLENDGLNHFGRSNVEVWNGVDHHLPIELQKIEWIPDNIGDKMIMTNKRCGYQRIFYVKSKTL